MAILMEYKCPHCGGKVEFDSGTQEMKCPYCDSTFDVEALKSMDEALKQETQDEMEWQTPHNQWGVEEGMIAYSCQSCGGQITADENTAATHCPYCDSPVMMVGKLSGTLKPDYIIPFKLDKEAAKAALKKHMSGKKLLPKSLSSDAKLEEIKGVYVPFWLYDADADAHIRYRGTRVNSWSDRNYIYTKTSFYGIDRAGELGFANVPVDGASKMPDDLMESLEPFDFSDAQPFQTAYMSGYLADKYDVTAEESIKRANQRVKDSTEKAFRDTVSGYATVTTEQSAVRLNNGKAKYAMYPVWLMTARYQDQQYLFAMNGQTGKMAGNLPMDKGAYRKWHLIYGAVISAAAFVLSWLIF